MSSKVLLPYFHRLPLRISEDHCDEAVSKHSTDEPCVASFSADASNGKARH